MHRGVRLGETGSVVRRPREGGLIMEEVATLRARSRAQTERLHALAALSDAALSRSLEDGWTIAAKLAHLAYWEGRQVGVLEAWQRHRIPPAWWTADEAHA